MMWLWSDRTRSPERRGGSGNGAVAAGHGSASHTLSPRCRVNPSSCFTDPEFSGIWGTEVAGGFDAIRVSEVFS